MANILPDTSIPNSKETLSKPNPRQVAEYVETALKQTLKDYNFDHPTVIPPTESKPNVYELIAVADPPESTYTRIDPDPAGTGLTSYKALETKSLLYIGTKGASIKLIFQWETEIGTWITSPYFLKGTEEKLVKCANPVNITDDINSTHPIPSIISKLHDINSGGGDVNNNNKLDGTDFEWVRDGLSSEHFTVGASNNEGMLYWEKLDHTSGVKLTGDSANKLILKIQALKEEEDPEKAVMQQLEKIITGNSEWAMDGPDNDFTISVPGEEFFWRDIEGFRDIMLTDNDRIKLVMQLEVVAAFPVPLK